MHLNGHIYFDSGSDDVVLWIVQLLSYAMVMDLNLCLQGTKTKAVYIGGGLACEFVGSVHLGGVYTGVKFLIIS